MDFTTYSLDNDFISEIEGVKNGGFYRGLKLYEFSQFGAANKIPADCEHLHIFEHNRESITPPTEYPYGIKVITMRGRAKKAFTFSSILPDSIEVLYCDSAAIKSFVNFPSNLKILSVAHNRLKSLPKLPDGLIYLNISTNKFNKMPEYLPESLEKLYSTGNNIIELPEKFHNNIKEINLGYCGTFPTFPNFPDNITIVNLERCYLKELPEFGQKLTFIEVSFNNLTTLGELPPNLEELYACNNKLVSMSYIPDSVTICCIDDNVITYLTNIPKSITKLDINNNLITELPEIPNEIKFIRYIEMSCNPIKYLSEHNFNKLRDIYSQYDDNTCIFSILYTTFYDIYRNDNPDAEEIKFDERDICDTSFKKFFNLD
jgi:hypothetical protein